MSHSICAPAEQVSPGRALSIPVGAALAAAGIALYFLHFTLPGLLIGFSHDDLMNLTSATRETYGRHLRDTLLFFQPAATYRPVGSLFYKALFDLFGFTPIPYRVGCFALLAVNLRLAWIIAKRLAGCRRTAFAATLLFAYHGAFWPLYQSTGFCYDLLCFFFYTSALALYLRCRRGSRVPSIGSLAAWAALYALCLGSKEMAVSLPIVILCYELLRGRPRDWMWLVNEGRVALLGAAMTVLFLAGRIGAPGSIATIEAYRPELRLTVYLERAAHLLSEALYAPSPLCLALAAAALVLFPLFSRNRAMCLGVIWAVTGILPIAFISQRGLAQAYVAVFGLALAAAAAVRTAAFRLPNVTRGPLLFLALPALLFWWHTRFGSLDYFALGSESRRIQVLYDQLETLSPNLPNGGSVLLLRDAFPENTWSSTFLVYLWARDYGAQVARIDQWLQSVNPGKQMSFDVVLSYGNGRLLQCDPRPFRAVEAARLAGTPCTVVAVAYP